MDISVLIKTRRKEKNMTMKELAEKVGVSEGTISRWESGEIKNMKRKAVAALSTALDVPPSVLMGWDESGHTPAAAAPVAPRCPLACTPREKDLIRKYRCLPAPVQGAVDAMIDAQYALACPRVKNEEEIS